MGILILTLIFVAVCAYCGAVMGRTLAQAKHPIVLPDNSEAEALERIRSAYTGTIKETER